MDFQPLASWRVGTLRGAGGSPPHLGRENLVGNGRASIPREIHSTDLGNFDCCSVVDESDEI